MHKLTLNLSFWSCWGSDRHVQGFWAQQVTDTSCRAAQRDPIVPCPTPRQTPSTLRAPIWTSRMAPQGIFEQLQMKKIGKKTNLLRVEQSQEQQLHNNPVQVMERSWMQAQAVIVKMDQTGAGRFLFKTGRLFFRLFPLNLFGWQQEQGNILTLFLKLEITARKRRNSLA